ncbi:highly ABA-induced PP2C gene 3 [Hibiscus trionum]|uniref:protein-serine/threonine phosphatase n=1 Tax=Hibiscus trionum TaxID=183268 RepID=A0A9W7MH00_HIBTR|nr:highly ABA-induced PP2C gene 3 [Hibiscus trionum]
MTSDSGQLNTLTVTRTENTRRRTLNCTYQTVMNINISETTTSNDGKDNEDKNLLLLNGSSKQSGGVRTLTLRSTHGVVSVIGRRREMEDAVKVELGLTVKGGGKFDFYGVYDGHGGSGVAEECKERLHKVLVEEIIVVEGDGIDWGRTMKRCFEKMDEEVSRGRLGEEMVGSTAVVAVVSGGKLVVANCGDSRAVLSMGGVAVALSLDHKPDRPDELERVEAAGGRVINWNGHRVLGVLATSRSIGDQYLKPFVICKPEVTVRELTDDDEFLILASDGMWDVVSNETACRVVRRCLNGRIKRKSVVVVDGNRNRAAGAAAVLVELAMARGSKDNISVIVVELNKP